MNGTIARSEINCLKDAPVYEELHARPSSIEKVENLAYGNFIQLKVRL